MRTLTTRQDAFVTEYAKHGNATQAALRAGYAASSAYQRGYELVNNSEIKEKLAGLGVLGIDTLAEIAHDNSYNELARVKAATALVDRAWGKPPRKNDIKPNITVQFDRIAN